MPQKRRVYRRKPRRKSPAQDKNISVGQTDFKECFDETPLHECCICLGDEVSAADVVHKPCKCTASYCKGCWDHAMCCTAPRCPSCRKSIGFDYDSDKGEPKFLLYDEPQSVSDGMIVLPYSLPEGYQPGAALPDVSINLRRASSRAQMVVTTLYDEMAKRTRPTLLKIMRDEKAKGDEARTCVCGGRSCLKRMSIEEARSKWPTPATWACTCDGCGEKQYQKDEENKLVYRNRYGEVTHIWQCDRKSSAHIFGFTVCDRCIRNPPTNLELPDCLAADQVLRGSSFRVST